MKNYLLTAKLFSCFAFVCLPFGGCAIDLHKDFEETRNVMVSEHLNFDHLVEMNARGGHVLSSGAGSKLKMTIIKSTSTATDYEIVWRNNCKYVLMVNNKTGEVVGWRYAVRDKTWCYTNP